MNEAFKFTTTPITRICKVYNWWLRIFLTIKSPDEWVITKQACRDDSIVSLFFPYHNIYRTLLLHIEHCTTEKLKHRLPIYNIYIALYFYISSTVLQKNWKTDFLYIYIYIIEVKESKRTHRFSVTRSFTTKRLSDRASFNEEHTSLYTN